MLRLLSLFATLILALGIAAPAGADPEDIDAAARGVVRVIVIGRDGEQIIPISHGTGFAVAPEMVVTNAHVVAEAVADGRLSLGIVPSDGGDAVYARLVAVSQRNDLALIEATTPMRLAPLTIAGVPPTDAGAVTAVGYPQNVDRAQGLDIEDIFRSQPPVKSTGFLSGRRPSREFDTLLHTAPIARGSSGGPLLDGCGRVIGVNSFGAEGTGADAEFFFSVSTRELLPFLRANNVAPRVNGMPCRSLADLEQADQSREQQRRAATQAQAAADERALAGRRAAAREEITFAVIGERENLMALTFLLLVVALGAGGVAWVFHQFHDDEEAADEEEAQENGELPRPERKFAAATLVAGGIALAAIAGAAGAWLARPGFSTIDGRLEDRLRAEMDEGDRGAIPAGPRGGAFACTLDEARSRVTGAAEPALALQWSEAGCVNARTQYGLAGGTWTRVFVPASEETVSVSHFDPAGGQFTVERYLLDREAMDTARAARGEYEAPACPVSPEAARDFGQRQASLVALLPSRPNERLVYNCSPQDAPAAGQVNEQADAQADTLPDTVTETRAPTPAVSVAETPGG